jgi:hypothetical protein
VVGSATTHHGLIVTALPAHRRRWLPGPATAPPRPR